MSNYDRDPDDLNPNQPFPSANIKSIEYDQDGWVKRVEYYPPGQDGRAKDEGKTPRRMHACRAR